MYCLATTQSENPKFRNFCL